MAQAAVPGFDVWYARKECGVLGLRFGAIHKWCFSGENVEALPRERAADECRIGLVCDPAVGGVEVGGVIATPVKR